METVRHGYTIKQGRYGMIDRELIKKVRSIDAMKVYRDHEDRNGLCPFCEENFIYVNEDNELCCDKCDWHGDVIMLIMGTKICRFEEAYMYLYVKYLAYEVGRKRVQKIKEVFLAMSEEERLAFIEKINIRDKEIMEKIEMQF